MNPEKTIIACESIALLGLIAVGAWIAWHIAFALFSRPHNHNRRPSHDRNRIVHPGNPY